MMILLSLLALVTPLTSINAVEMQAALRGEIPVRAETIKRPDGKAAGQGLGAIIIERPLAEVWATLAHFEDKPEYMPRLKALSVLEKGPDRLRVRMVVDASILTTRYTVWFKLDPAAHTINWQLDHSATDNGIAEAEGEYRMEEIAKGRTLVIYRSYIDSGRSVPRFIQEHMTRRSIPNLLRAIKARIESGGRWRTH